MKRKYAAIVLSMAMVFSPVSAFAADNTADAEALKSLTGIGDAKAQAILAYREEHGAFSGIEEIMQVPGIKESTFSAIKDKIAVK